MRNYRQKVDFVRQQVYSKWIIRYRAFVQKRFNKLSRGSGEWPPLRYRKGSILRDTNTLFTVMAPTLQAPGGSVNDFLSDKSGVEIGYDGNQSHPGGATIAQIAFWHQTGAGNLPIRKIIVPPDNTTLQAMVMDMERALRP